MGLLSCFGLESVDVDQVNQMCKKEEEIMMRRKI